MKKIWVVVCHIDALNNDSDCVAAQAEKAFVSKRMADSAAKMLSNQNAYNLYDVRSVELDESWDYEVWDGHYHRYDQSGAARPGHENDDTVEVIHSGSLKSCSDLIQKLNNTGRYCVVRVAE